MRKLLARAWLAVIVLSSAVCMAIVKLLPSNAAAASNASYVAASAEAEAAAQVMSLEAYKNGILFGMGKHVELAATLIDGGNRKKSEVAPTTSTSQLRGLITGSSSSSRRELIDMTAKVVGTGPANRASSFGYSIALASFALVVGAPYEGSSYQGAAYVYVPTGINSFSLLQRLVTNVAGAQFGCKVAVGGGGGLSNQTIAVGASEESGSDGAVYIYYKVRGSFTQMQRIFIGHAAQHTNLGSSLAFASGYSGTLASGGYYWNDGNGIVVVYAQVMGTYVQTGSLTHGDYNGYLGWSVALTDKYLVGGGNRGNLAYIYTYMVGSWGSWTRTQILGPRTDQFGYASSISTFKDVTTVIVTACGGDQSAYIYVLTGGSFTQTQKLQVSTASSFGYSATMGYGWLIIGANGDSPNGAQYLFMYDTPSSSYSLQQRFTPADGVGLGLSHPKTGRYSSSATSTDFNTNQIALGDFYGGDDAIGTKVGEAMIMNFRFSPPPTPYPTPAPSPPTPSPRPTPTPTTLPTQPSPNPTPYPTIMSKNLRQNEYTTGFLVSTKYRQQATAATNSNSNSNSKASSAAAAAAAACSGVVASIKKKDLSVCHLEFSPQGPLFFKWTVRTNSNLVFNGESISTSKVFYSDAACVVRAKGDHMNNLWEHYQNGCDTKSNVKMTYSSV